MKIIQAVLPLLILASQGFSIPASDVTFPLEQPDGTVIQVRQVGDERFNFFETADGHILQMDPLGYYAYADENGKSSGIFARNAGDRNEADVLFLSKLDQNSIYERLKDEARSSENFGYETPKRAKSTVQKMPSYNRSGDVHVLVILAQYQDVKFKSADPVAQFTDYLNKEGYNEYYNTGSVRDYFIKNSNGKFRPIFDVYGPVTLSKERAAYGQMDNTPVKEARDLLNWDEIDLSLYGNYGTALYTSVIFAGVSSAGSGVTQAVWPHQGRVLGQLWSDDRRINNYSCSNEISSHAYAYNHETSALEGIGVFIHEFSHMLGLMDMYDVSKSNKRESVGYWSVMANGDNLCRSNPDYVMNCSPVLYTAFEKMSMGWLTPEELKTSGPLRLDKIDDNAAYSVTNPNNSDEVYLLEYRSMKGWDSELPKSGMLVWHIDYDSDVWSKNEINYGDGLQHADIIEAVPRTSGRDSAEDPFPGAGKVTEFNKFIFNDGRNANIAISSIKESEDHEYVLFNVCMKASTCPTIEWSSSSVESSSSEILSSSEIESSSSEESSSSSAPESSSSEQSSSSVEESSSSEIVSSSSEEKSSSSEEKSSSSVESSSSNVEPESSAASSSSEDVSSSSVESSSSEDASSSSVESSSSEERSSSSDAESSSSEEVESSSSESPVGVVSKIIAQGVRVNAKNGTIYVYAPQQGRKVVRIFSPIGSLLLERTMDGSELVLNDENLRKMSVILSVRQGNKTLFTGKIDIR